MGLVWTQHGGGGGVGFDPCGEVAALGLKVLTNLDKSTHAAVQLGGAETMETCAVSHLSALRRGVSGRE